MSSNYPPGVRESDVDGLYRRTCQCGREFIQVGDQEWCPRCEEKAEEREGDWSD